MKIILSVIFSIKTYKYLFYHVGYFIINFIYPRLKLEIGQKTKLHPTVLLRQVDNISIGDFGLINHGCVLQAGYDNAEIRIGDKVHFGPYVTIFAYNHAISDKFTPSIDQGYVEKSVFIGDDVWIGAGTVILAGVNIPRGCVVGAGSVVTGDLQFEYGVYAGNPAKFKKFRYE